MNLKKTLNEYYSKRAKEYDDVYHRPDKTRLKEQEFLAEYITQTFKGKYVLELACGTGFWTRHLPCLFQNLTQRWLTSGLLNILFRSLIT